MLNKYPKIGPKTLQIRRGGKISTNLVTLSFIHPLVAEGAREGGLIKADWQFNRIKYL